MLRWRRGLRMVVRLRVEQDLEVRRARPDRDRRDLVHRAGRAVPIVADLAVRSHREPMEQPARVGSSGRWAGGGMTSL
jgi:hypothetical protein